jgi:peptide/nickel transport system substrate-binding protein
LTPVPAELSADRSSATTGAQEATATLPSAGGELAPARYEVAGELHLAVRETIRTLNPFATNNESEAFVTAMLYDHLMEYEPGNGFVANLAERWEIAADGGRLIIWLDPRARWQSGAAVTVDDVVFTYRFIRERSLPGWSAVAAAVHRVEAISAREVQFTLLNPSPEVIRRVCAEVPIVPAALWRDLEDPLSHTNLERPIGSGPFFLDEYIPEEQVVLRNMQAHHSTQPAIAALVVEIVRDETKALHKLNEGSLDALGWDVLPSVVGDVRDHPELYPGVLWASVAGSVQRAVLLNVRLPPYNDPQLRLALTQALDAASIVDQVMLGFGEPSSSDPFAPASEWHDAAGPLVAYDPQAAGTGLDTAGYLDVNGDGLRDMPDGTALQIPITAASAETQQRVAEMIVACWKAVGIASRVVRITPEEMLPTLMGASFEAVLADLAVRDPDDIYLYVHSSQGDLKGSLVSGRNYGGHASDTVDRTVELLREASEPSSRLRLLRETQAILSSELPWLPLFSPQVLSLYSETRFSGWSPVSGIGLLDRRVIARLVAQE